MKITRREFGGFCAAGALARAYAQPAVHRESIDLDGAWQFSTDGKTFNRSITVPGAWQAQGVGEPAGILRHQYEGAATYRRTVRVPESWRGQTISLRVAGAHRITTAFVNGIEVGGHDGFSAPFSFDVSRALRPGADNEIVLRIENPPFTIDTSPDKQVPRFPTGMLNYIANWGGIYGEVALEAAPETRVESVLIIPSVRERIVTFQVNAGGGDAVHVTVPGVPPQTSQLSAGSATVRVPAVQLPLWTPDQPRVLTAAVTLLDNGREIDRLEQRFGFREITTSGNVLLLNGRPLYLRGYGDDNIEVLTGFPASSAAVIRERLERAKSFGFNAVRFHSMVPPAEYFEVADEVGILVMAELPAAYTQYFFAHRDFLKRELASVLKAYRNHPSLLSLAFGNEFNLRWLKTDADRTEFLASIAEFYKAAKELAPATLIMSNDGFDMRPTDMISVGRGAVKDRPVVRHEFGAYYCSLPDVRLIPRFTGVIKPDWLAAKKEWLEKHALADVYPEYLRNSWRLQQLGRKYQIERARADGRVSGYDYWLIIDFPGGTGEGDSWEEGWFNYFWEPKGIVPEQGRRLNSPVLLMIDAGVGDRTMWAGARKRIGVTVSNYGDDAIRNARIAWQLLDRGAEVASGELADVNAELGSVSHAGALELQVPSLSAPKKLELVLKLPGHENRWDFWAYPKTTVGKPAIPVISHVKLAALQHAFPWLDTEASAPPANALLVTESLDDAARAHLENGGRVWLMLRETPRQHAIQFFPASGGALGTVIRDHPAVRDFAHEGFCDLQFYNLLDGAAPLSIDSWPHGTDPIIGAIRTTSEFLSKTKALSHAAFAIEGRAGNGRLLITTLRLRDNFDEAYPEAMTLTAALLRYAASDAFAPQQSIPRAVLERLSA